MSTVPLILTTEDLQLRLGQLVLNLWSTEKALHEALAREEEVQESQKQVDDLESLVKGIPPDQR